MVFVLQMSTKTIFSSLYKVSSKLCFEGKTYFKIEKAKSEKKKLEGLK